MPYSGPADPKLPEHVQRLNKSRRERWVAVFNEVIGRSNDEQRAFRAANSLLSKALLTQLSAEVTDAALTELHDTVHAMEPLTKSADERLDMAALHYEVLREMRKRGVVHEDRSPTIRFHTDGDPEYRTEVAKANDEWRYTFSVVYKADDGSADAHNEYAVADDLQRAQWDYVRAGNRSIYLQHGVLPKVGFQKAGEWVDLVSWPYAVTTTLKAAGTENERTIPPGSVWMGVVWEPWAWELVKSGQIRGFSFGGLARRERS